MPFFSLENSEKDLVEKIMLNRQPKYDYKNHLWYCWITNDFNGKPFTENALPPTITSISIKLKFRRRMTSQRIYVTVYIPCGIISGFFSKLSTLPDKPPLNVASHDCSVAPDVSVCPLSGTPSPTRLRFNLNITMDAIKINKMPNTKPATAPSNNLVWSEFPVYGKRKSSDGNSSIFIRKK